MKTLLLLLFAIAPVAEAARAAGVVRDPGGAPLPGVTLFAKSSPLTTVTDEKGAFALDVEALPVTLTAFLDGFSASEVVVKDGSPIVIRLELAVVSETVVVSARPLRAESSTSSAYELKTLDILKAAGAQADVMRALQTMPGVAKVDDGAGLFVRGGDVSEVRVLLDGATIAHPFRYETPAGGMFGSVTPMLLEGLTFSTGGFSAKWGNALSAILDLRGLGKPSSSQLLVSAGLASVSTRDSIAGSDKAGLRLSGNLATTSLLFAVNGKPRQFDHNPSGWDLDASAHYESPLGSFKLFAMSQADRVGVSFQQESYDGFLHSSSRQNIVSASWRRGAGPWLLTSALGIDSFRDTTNAGVLALTNTDRRTSWRFDASRMFGGMVLRAGADADVLRTTIAGSVPFRPSDFGGVSGVKSFDVGYPDNHAGAFAEVERASGRLTITAGLRGDAYRNVDNPTLDPRLNLSYALAGGRTLRLAWGLYHQTPSAQYFDRVAGARSLQAMQAEHWIAGFESGTIDGPLFLRLEAYRKEYSHLPLQDASVGFTSAGYGYARGADLFIQKKWRLFELRGSASVVDTKRRWTAATQRNRFALPDGAWRPDFDIPRTLAFNGIAHVTPAIDAGLAVTYASGHPNTPIVGATETPTGFVPIYAAINSERLPAYARCDANVSYRSHAGTATGIVYFAAVGNLLGRQNYSSYSYSPDFTQRAPIVSANPRSFYVGLSIIR
jgi:hypothetical protein